MTILVPVDDVFVGEKAKCDQLGRYLNQMLPVNLGELCCVRMLIREGLGEGSDDDFASDVR